MTDPVSRDSLRVGTPEREDTIHVLGVHVADERLPRDDYERRVALARQAQTQGDLRSLFADLPPPYPQFMSPPKIVVWPPDEEDRGFVSDKNRFIAGLLQLVLPVGAGRFYLRDTGVAVAQLLTAFIAVGVIWCFIDGIILLAIGGRDGDGLRLPRR